MKNYAKNLLKNFTIKNKTKTIMMLQTIIFNSTEKTVKVYEEHPDQSTMVNSFINVPTVKIKPEGFYEVIQKEVNSDSSESNYPVARYPIANTNMLIEH